MTTDALDTPKPGLKAEFAGLVRLASPIIVNNLAIAGMGFADTVMAGSIDAKALAAVAVGNSTWMLFFLFALGVLMAISPIGSRYLGAGRGYLMGRYARQGFWLSLMIAAVVVATIQLGAAGALEAIGIDPEFRQLTVDYLRAIVWGAPAAFAYLVLRYTTEGIGWTRPVMYVSIGALAVNVTGNWLFMFGNLGAPEMGAVGAGVASAITMYFMFASLLAYMLLHPRYREYEIFRLGRGPQWAEMREILALGLPIMVSIIAEAGLFSAVSLLMGKLSASIAAAHQVALNYASTMFMIPMGLNSATTVLVSRALGAGDVAAARLRGWLGIAACAGFMTVSALGLLLFRDQIVGFYTDDASVQAIALSLLLVAAIFQVSDGVQVGAAGALRGLHDTRVPMYLTTFSYWVIAFPLAYAAALHLKLSPAMIWGGFVVGLTVSAVLLVSRFAWSSRQRDRLVAVGGG
jgi:MATE family multidrug resistance protein